VNRGTIVLDLDGVVVLGGEPIPGSGEALTRLAADGYTLLFATNNATRTPAETADRIRRLTGFPAEADRVITSTIAAARLLAGSELQPVFPAAEPGMAQTLRGEGIAVTGDHRAAHSVLVGLNRSFTYDLLRRAAAAVHRGARLFATNADPTFPTPHGPEPGAGALVAAVEMATGQTARVAGKPHEAMRDAIAARIATGPVWMVGDRPETDLALAHRAGWIPVLVLSGVTTDPSTLDADLAPAMTLPDLSSLPAALAQNR
jgi:HAD superfamily hydrolase (TIGR01450 family)